AELHSHGALSIADRAANFRSSRLPCQFGGAVALVNAIAAVAAWPAVQHWSPSRGGYGRLPPQRGYRADARSWPPVLGPAGQPRWLAVPPGRHELRRDAPGGHVPGAAGGGRPRAPARGGAGQHPRLAALPPAPALHPAREPARLHRPEAGLVPAASHWQRRRRPPGPVREAGIRLLALGGFLVPGPARGQFQARGLYAGPGPPGAARPRPGRRRGRARARRGAAATGDGPRPPAGVPAAAAGGGLNRAPRPWAVGVDKHSHL